MVSLLIVASVAALADRPPDIAGGPEQSAYKHLLVKAAIGAEALYSLQPICTKATVADASTRVLTVDDPPTGYLAKLALEAVRVRGCGREMLVNLAVLPREDRREWILKLAAPGGSHADPFLQARMLEEVVAVIAKAAPAHCSSPKLGHNLAVGEVRVTSPRGTVFAVLPGEKVEPPPQSKGGTYSTLAVSDPSVVRNTDASAGWQEEWPLRACGQDRSVLVWFLPLKSPRGKLFTAVSPRWGGTYTNAKPQNGS